MGHLRQLGLPTGAEELTRFRRRAVSEQEQRARRPRGRTPSPQPGTSDLLEQLLRLGAGGRGGGGGGIDFAGRSELQRRRLSFEGSEAEKTREFAIDQERRRRAAERKERIGELLAGRQSSFARLLGDDPVRARLLALGLGPEAGIFRAQAQELGTTLAPLRGAVEGRDRLQEALSRIIGGRDQVGARGVTGLGSAIKAARAFSGGGFDIQRLLASAFGIGQLGGGGLPGISREELESRVRSVTPTGIL